MTWLIIAIVIGVAFLLAYGAIALRDLLDRREAEKREEARTPTRPVNEATHGERCHRCGQLPVFEDVDTYLAKNDDGKLRCRKCWR